LVPSPSVKVYFFDEEPPADIYTEGLTRTNATAGIVWLTFTPLLGMSDVVRSFLEECGAGTSTHVTYVARRVMSLSAAVRSARTASG
jgi:phage terminase large subunit-like protein